jgi:hypothetical protein
MTGSFLRNLILNELNLNLQKNNNLLNLIKNTKIFARMEPNQKVFFNYRLKL